jgi:hypothetical protein
MVGLHPLFERSCIVISIVEYLPGTRLRAFSSVELKSKGNVRHPNGYA